MDRYHAIVERWKQREIKDVNDLQTVLQNFRIVFAYHSGKIENQEITYHNTREIFENGKVVNYTGELRTLYEIQNQKECYDFLKYKIIAREPVTPALIKDIHRMLTQGTYDEARWSKGERPGQFKKHDYVVANDQGALPEDVEDEISELCEEIENIDDRGDNIIKTAAYLHCKFENTHPFADGNGRAGRTLMNYYLMIHNHPPLIIFENTKDLYYRALGYYDETGEIDQFVSYMKESMIQSWEKRHAPERRLDSFLEKQKD